MRYYCIYDLIISKAREKKETSSDLLKYFKSKNITKVSLLNLKDSGMMPANESLLQAVLEYLDMSTIELELALGRLPKGYENIYFNNIKNIAAILTSQAPVVSGISLPSETASPFYSSELGQLYKGDCLRLFSNIHDNSVDCIFADPPFNLNKEYDDGVDDDKSYSQYISWCISWLDQCIRVLKPNGSLFIYNIPKWHTYLSSYLNERLKFWDWIAIDMKFNFPIANRLYPAHYSLMYYVKGEKPKTFNSQRIPLATCRHCGGETRDYGGYKSKMKPNGVNLSDIWSDIYPVRHNSTKSRKYNQLPIKLLDRIISLSTNKGDLVLDPFGGSGTTYAICELLGRKWLGFEIGDCEVITQRLLNKENDRGLLEKIYHEKNILFPKEVKELRKRNGFWLDEDFREANHVQPSTI